MSGNVRIHLLIIFSVCFTNLVSVIIYPREFDSSFPNPVTFSFFLFMAMLNLTGKMQKFLDQFHFYRYRYRLKRQKLDKTAFRLPAPKMTNGGFRFSWSVESLEFGQSTASSIENDRLWQCAYPLLWLARIAGAIRIPTKQGTWKWMAMRAYSWLTLVLLLLGLCGNVAFFRPGFEHMGPITIVKCITLVFWASAVVNWWMLRYFDRNCMDRFTRRMQLIDMADFRPLPYLLRFSIVTSVLTILSAFSCAIFAQLNALRIVDILLFTDFSNGIPGLQFVNWIPVFYGCLTIFTLSGLQINALIALMKLAKAFTHHLREIYDYEQLVNSYQQFDILAFLHEVIESAWNVGNFIDIILLKLPLILCGVYVACGVKNITVGALMLILIAVTVFLLLTIAYLIPAILYYQHREPILEAYLKMGERIELTNAFWLHLERIRAAPTSLSLGHMVRLTGKSIGTVAFALVLFVVAMIHVSN